MTLDEAIKHAEEVAEEHTKYNIYGGFESCDECATDYRQLAKWLKDYERLLEQEPKMGKWIPVSDPLKELPKDRTIWVTYIVKYPNGYCYEVELLFYDMTEWSDDFIAKATIAYMDYEEPKPYEPQESEVKNEN